MNKLPVFVENSPRIIFVKSRIIHEECTVEFSKCQLKPWKLAFVKIPVHDEWSSRFYKNNTGTVEDEYGCNLEW